MKFVALVSGGKDSIFNIAHCIKQGHEPVALAHLEPPATHADTELDSFMYQTAGWDAISSIAEAMGLPLVRRTITGTAVRQDLDYVPTQQDEVEDLFLLLQDAKNRYPEIEAVACGAIFSDYQRLRLENVCGRLSLTALCFLWRREQGPLLQDMVDFGMHAVLVKVASIGLTGKHLNRSIQDLQPLFQKLCQQYGFNVCGEGGEYETLTLDCPLYRSALVLEEVEVVSHSNDAFAPVALLKVKKVRLQPKELDALETPVEFWRRAVEHLAVPEQDLSIPIQRGSDSTGDESASDEDDNEDNEEGEAKEKKEKQKGYKVQSEEFSRCLDRSAPLSLESIAEALRKSSISSNPDDATSDPLASTPLPTLGPSKTPVSPAHFAPVLKKDEHFLWLSGVSVRSLGLTSDSFPSPAEELKAVLTAISELLSSQGSSLSAVLQVHLYVQDMGQFSALNAAYCSFFAVNPPSRVCIEVPLSGERVLVSCCVSSRSLPRRCLHVQSVSHWAPACIGPYSQANEVGDLLFTAGQIALDPPSMSIPPALAADVDIQFKRALKSYHQVLQVMKSGLKDVLAGVVFYVAGSDLPLLQQLCSSNLSLNFTDKPESPCPPLLFIQVPKLPRSALVELEFFARTQEIRSCFKWTTNTAVLPVSGFHCIVNSVHIEGLLLTAITVGAPVSPSPSPPSVDDLVTSLFAALLQESALASISAEHLRSLRVFFRPDLMDQDQLRAAIMSRVKAVKRLDVTAVCLIPVNHISSSASSPSSSSSSSSPLPSAYIGAQLTLYNGLFVDTMKWIGKAEERLAGKKMFTDWEDGR